MPFTRDQIDDIKCIIKQTITELLTDDKFTAMIAEKVSQKLNIEDMQNKLKDMEKTVKTLQEVNKNITNKMESLQQHMKRKSLRIYGVSEEPNENLHEKTIKIVNEKVKVKINAEDIENCFRTGRNHNGKRPILLTVNKYVTKQNIIMNRKLLRGTNIMISEDMTFENHKLLREAETTIGKGKVWFYNGKISAKIGPTTHHIKSSEDINRIKAE